MSSVEIRARVGVSWEWCIRSAGLTRALEGDLSRDEALVPEGEVEPGVEVDVVKNVRRFGLRTSASSRDSADEVSGEPYFVNEITITCDDFPPFLFLA